MKVACMGCELKKRLLLNVAFTTNNYRMLFQEAHKQNIETYINFQKMQGSTSVHYNVFFPKSWPDDIIKAGQDLIIAYLESEELSFSDFMPLGENHDQIQQEIYISWSDADTKVAIDAGYNMRVPIKKQSEQSPDR